MKKKKTNSSLKREGSGNQGKDLGCGKGDGSDKGPRGYA